MPGESMNGQGGVRVGAYGKLPTRGDFLRRGLSPETITCFDAWLQQRLFERPPDWRTGAQPWRFLASPGVFGLFGLVGVMAPSCDKIGRQFPFLIGIEFSMTAEARFVLDQTWLTEAERVIDQLSLVEETGPSLDQALSTLTAIGDCDEPSQIDLEGCSYWWRGPNFEGRVQARSAPDADLFACMMEVWEPTRAIAHANASAAEMAHESSN